MENVEFKDKIILVTGATSGIGAATAIQLSKYGASLGLVGRNRERLIATGEKCKERPLCMQADLTIDEDVKCVAKVFIERFKKIDILINCAAVLEKGSIEDTNMKQYDKIMNLNVRSMYHLTMLLVPELIKTKGIILNVSSVYSLLADANFIAYNMSKAAVDHFTKCLAIELGPKGVRCNAINPGVVPTEMYKVGGLDEAAYKKHMAEEKKSNCLGRLGDIKEVINAIIFLISANSSFITGITLPIDGGRHVMNPGLAFK